MKKVFLTFAFLVLVVILSSAQEPTVSPAFQVDFPAPTRDKPQSKLWFMDGHWWALLPDASGPSL